MLEISLQVLQQKYMRNWLIILFLIGISIDINAQILAGVKIGTNITSINYDEKPGQPVYNMDRKIGYMGGLVFQQFSTRNFGLQIELNYIQKGWKTAYDTTFNTQYERNIEYLDIPFLTHASFGINKSEFIIELGFFTGFALQSSEVFYDAGIAREQEYEFEPDRDNRIEYGLQGGVGIKRKFKFGILQLEGNYSFTFNSVYKWGYSSDDFDFKRYFDIPEQAQNQGIYITISYLYPIIKTKNE